jgi:hypothetical protein
VTRSLDTLYQPSAILLPFSAKPNYYVAGTVAWTVSTCAPASSQKFLAIYFLTEIQVGCFKVCFGQWHDFQESSKFKPETCEASKFETKMFGVLHSQSTVT